MPKLSKQKMILACICASIFSFGTICSVQGSGAEVAGETVKYKQGDVNHSGKVDVQDCIAFQKYLLNSNITVNLDCMDLNSDSKINIADFCLLKQQIIDEASKPPVTQPPSGSRDPKAIMEAVRNSLRETEPQDIIAEKPGVDYGKVETKKYFSKTANKDKVVNVILPGGYSENEKYPVLYVLHGIFGDQNSMFDQTMKIPTMISNLTASGEAEKMIIVFPAMFTSPTMDACTGFDVESSRAYDNFLFDIADSLMPFMEETYSVKTGRENTAITGFSMGGREALYIGLKRPDLFGYIGCGCPAPGIVATTDSFMKHEGCLTESEMKTDPAYKPYLLMISAGMKDEMIRDYPEQYHNFLTANGENHIWHPVANGDHGGKTIRPHIYNFAKALFK